MPAPVAFWNLERLFAAGGSPIHAALAGGRAPSVSAADVDEKVAVVAAVLKALARAHGRPALLGLAEIETAGLVEQLATASGLGLASVEGTADDELGLSLEGLDISLLYDPDRFDAPVRLRSHVLDTTFDTRDVLEVHLPERATGRLTCVLICHWPSRLSLESADRRVAAAFYVRQLVGAFLRFQPQELWDPVAGQLRLPLESELQDRARRPVVVMGDFNDEPFDRSLDLLNSTPDPGEVDVDLRLRGATALERYSSYAGWAPPLYNATWRLCTGAGGTYYRSPRWRVYDQVIMSRGGIELLGLGTADTFRQRTVRVGRRTVALQTPSGRPLGFDAARHRGASDHFPIVCAPGA